MAYESIKKPASTVVPVQKKATVSAPPGMMGQSVETAVPQVQEQTLSNKPATDDDWLMKSGLFTGQHLLQRLSSPVSESVSSEREVTTGEGQVEQRQEETVQGSETALPHSLLPTPHSLPLQAKLTIGEPNDVYEQEADRVARQVVDKIHSPAPETVQRQEMGDEEEVQRKSDAGEGVTGVRNTPIQGLKVNRKSMSVGQTSEASAELEASIQGKRGSGQPLDESVRKPMEGAFGADFSGVRVHTDTQSDELNQAIQAKAFTTGEDIFFSSGAYGHGSRGGQELLAHELTHVVQQNDQQIQRKLTEEVDKERLKENLLQIFPKNLHTLIDGLIVQIEEAKENYNHEEAVEKAKNIISNHHIYRKHAPSIWQGAEEKKGSSTKRTNDQMTPRSTEAIEEKEKNKPTETNLPQRILTENKKKESPSSSQKPSEDKKRKLKEEEETGEKETGYERKYEKERITKEIAKTHQQYGGKSELAGYPGISENIRNLINDILEELTRNKKIFEQTSFEKCVLGLVEYKDEVVLSQRRNKEKFGMSFSGHDSKNISRLVAMREIFSTLYIEVRELLSDKDYERQCAAKKWNTANNYKATCEVWLAPNEENPYPLIEGENGFGSLMKSCNNCVMELETKNQSTINKPPEARKGMADLAKNRLFSDLWKKK